MLALLAGCGGGNPTPVGREVSPVPPSTAPAGLATAEGVRLSWNPSSTGGVTAYRVYRRDSAGIRTQIGETSGEDTTFTDTAPLSGSSSYSITAVKLQVESAETDQLIWGT